MPTITLEELAALEKLANERLESKSVYENVTIYARTLQQLCAAARRGVEADQTIAIWQVEIRDRNETIANLKAELAALKVQRDEAVRREIAFAEAVWGNWINPVEDDDGNFGCMHCNMRFHMSEGWIRATHDPDCIVIQAKNAIPARNHGDSNRRDEIDPHAGPESVIGDSNEH